MHKDHWIVPGVLATGTLANHCFSQVFTKGASVSGIIVRSNHKVWLDGFNTRQETITETNEVVRLEILN